MIAVPNVGMIRAQLVDWLMRHKSFGHETVLLSPAATIYRPLTRNRNYARQEFLGSDADALLQLDSDMAPAQDLLKIADNDVDICSASVWTTKGNETFPLCMKRTETGYDIQTGEGLIECDAIGGGCMLIKRKVLEDVEFPFITDEYPSEDFGFCEIAKEKGYRVFFDTRYRCYHFTICCL